MPTIEVVSDVVCPWCFIGKRRLGKALALLDRQDITVRWKPFQLNPNAPREGWNRKEYRAKKFGSLEYAKQLEDRVAAAGASEDIAFRFDLIERTPNTLDAHRLIWLASNQDAMVERLFQAYFLAGKDIGDPEVLKHLAEENGIDLFKGDEGRNEVVAEESGARAHGVNGVPTFFVDGTPVTSGAHPPELLAQMLKPLL
jgi:predicted DsbA family dithiol-disulfide isomerase